jgi:hypothetical protein
MIWPPNTGSAQAQVRRVDSNHFTLAFRGPDAVLTAISDVAQ